MLRLINSKSCIAKKITILVAQPISIFMTASQDLNLALKITISVIILLMLSTIFDFPSLLFSDWVIPDGGTSSQLLAYCRVQSCPPVVQYLHETT